MKKILVAVDGSKNSDKALAEAKKIGTCLESHISVIYVMEDIMSHPYVHMQDYKGALDEAFKDQGTEVLERAKKELEDYNGEVEFLLKPGNPGNRILKVAEEGEYDLIVMGSRGLNAVSRVMIGSVSNKVVNRSDVSVLIVK